MEFILIFVGSLFLYALIESIITAPGRSLRNAFTRAGILQGKTKEEIIALVGKPTSVSYIGNIELLQWMVSGYHIVLPFTDNICDGVSHQFDQAGRAILFG